MMTEEQFDDVVVKMERVFDHNMSPPQRSAYHHYLSQLLSCAEFQRAAKHIILHHDTFPSLAAIIRAAEIEV